MTTTRQNIRGTVLIVVMWASLGLVSVALLFGHSMLMAYRGSDNDLAGQQADQAIEGAARYVESLLTSNTTPGVLPDVTTYENEEVPVGEATFWLLGRQLDTGGTVDSKTPTYGLVDEASKLNLNAYSPTQLPTMIQNLNLPNMTPDFAQAIADWRSTSGGGGVSGTSSSVKQAPFESIEELGFVTGATRDILYGEDANLNGVLDPNEDDDNANLPADNGDGKLDPGLLEYVTVFSRESNKGSDGTNRLNVAGLGVNVQPLQDLLDTKLGTGRGAAIVAALTPGTPLTSPLDIYLQAKGANFSEDDFAKVAYELTATDPAQNPYITGLINVNTASAAVLACVPGFDANSAAQVVSARLNRTQTDANYAWVVDALGAQATTVLAQAGRYLTGKCSQVTADIAAVGRNGRGYRRVKMVIDISSGTPQIVYRRNLAPLGWALGSDVRDDLASQRTTR